MKRLLVITSGFPQIKTNRYNCQFVFDLTLLAEKSFDQIDVISPQPIFPKFLRKFPFLESYSRYANYEDYQVGKISIYYPKFFTLPLHFFRQRYDLSFFQTITHTLNKLNHKYHLVHAHFLYPTGQALRLLQKELPLPTLLSLHGGDIYEWPRLSSANLAIAKKVLLAVDQIVVPSKYLLTEVVATQPNCEEKTKIISHTINLKTFNIKNKSAVRKQLRIPVNAVVLLNVANLIKGKGHQDLTEAYRLLIKKIPNLHLYIIGEGPQKNFLKNWIKKYHLKSVHLVGGVDHSQLADWYNAANLFVFPSYYESFGIVQLEALACGIPIVAYDNAASKELIGNHQQLGLLSPRGKPELLAKNIHLALNKVWRSQTIRRYVTTYYNQKAIFATWTKLYQKLSSKEA